MAGLVLDREGFGPQGVYGKSEDPYVTERPLAVRARDVEMARPTITIYRDKVSGLLHAYCGVYMLETKHVVL